MCYPKKNLRNNVRKANRSKNNDKDETVRRKGRAMGLVPCCTAELFNRLQGMKKGRPGEVAQQLRHLLLLQRTLVQFLALTWQLTTTCNLSRLRSDTFLWLLGALAYT